MSKKAIVALVVVILVLGGIYGLSRNKNNGTNNSSTGYSLPANKTTSTNSSQSSDQSTSNSQQSASHQANTVSIENFAFTPGDITVKKGTTVTWVNNDTTTHTVTEMDSQDGPKSGNLAQGDKYTFTFNNVGTFKYHCQIHPDMLGTVTVTD